MGTIGSRELVKAIRELPRPSAGDLATAVNASRPVVIRRLKALEQEGIIEWIGGHEPARSAGVLATFD